MQLLRRRPAVVLFAFLSGCSFGGEVPANARISCTKDSACPAGFDCVEDVGYCVRTGSDLPSVEVTFTLPRDGDEGVSLTPAAVLVFNMEAAVPEPDLVSLVSENGSHVVPVTVSTTNSANTLLLEPKELLFPLTRYVLTVRPGVPPVAGEIAVPSQATWVATFKTTDSTDDEAPLPVSAMVTTLEDNTYSFSWTASASADQAGVVVLSSTTGAITDAPAAGASYAVGQMIGSARVAYVGIGTGGTDIPAPFTDTARYSAFAFDTALNYAPAAGAPPATLKDAVYCSDKMGMFHLASPDLAFGQAAIGNATSTVLADAALIPASPVALPVSVPITPGTPFVAGTVVYARPVSIAGDARFIGASTRITIGGDVSVTASATLSTAVAQATIIGGWDAYEAQLDTNPQAGNETWGPALPGTNTVYATGLLPNGAYRFRVRPYVPGCATPPWTLSNEFTVGDNTVVYVASGGTGSGITPDDPVGSISASISKVATAGTVNVAVGIYSEALQLTKSVKVMGGWNTAFTTRDPMASVTTVTSIQNTLTINGGVDAATLIDGFKLVATGAGAPLASVITGSLTLSNNRFEGALPIVISGGAPQFVNNTIAGTSPSTATVTCTAGQPRFEGNTITNESGSTAAGTSLALDIAGSCNLTAIANTIQAQSATSSTSTCAAIHFTFGGGTIINNRVAGGDCGTSHGIWLDSPASAPAGGVLQPIIISNNTIIADDDGMSLDNTRGAAATWDIRITNNLIFSPSAFFVGFDVYPSFSAPESIQNNWVARAGGSPNFACFRAKMSSSTCVKDNIDDDLCLRDVIAGGNQVGSASPFLDFLGPDGRAYTVADNNWKLAPGTATKTVRQGGLTLGGGNNCGGSGCPATKPNASCGSVDNDFVSTPRTTPYAIGAYEVD